MDIVSYLFLSMLKAMGTVVVWSANMVGSGINRLLIRGELKKIEQGNDAARQVITLPQPQPIASLIADLQPSGKSIVTGEDANENSAWRNVVTQKVVAAAAGSRPVVVLHQRNHDLVGRLHQVLGSKLIAMDAASARFDIISGFSASEVCSVLLDPDVCADMSLGERSRQYLKTVLDLFVRVYGHVPTFTKLAMVVAWPKLKLKNQLEAWIDSGKLPQAEALEFMSLLEANISGQASLDIYLQRIASQLSSVLAPSNLPVSSRVTLAGALQQGKSLTLDLSSVTDHKRIMNLLALLIKRVAIDHRALLVLDDHNYRPSTQMLSLITSRPPTLGLHLSLSDVTALCPGDETQLNAVLSGCQCRMVMTHSAGASCEALSKALGTYRHHVVERSIGLGSGKDNKRMMGSSNTQKGYAIREEVRPRVRPDEISSLPTGVVFMTTGTSPDIRHCGISE